MEKRFEDLGQRLVVEQDLSSNSTTNIPAVKAVKTITDANTLAITKKMNAINGSITQNLSTLDEMPASYLNKSVTVNFGSSSKGATYLPVVTMADLGSIIHVISNNRLNILDKGLDLYWIAPASQTGSSGATYDKSVITIPVSGSSLLEVVTITRPAPWSDTVAAWVPIASDTTGLAFTTAANTDANTTSIAIAQANIFGRYRGQWAANTAYFANDLVIDPSFKTIVSANQAFTSNGSYNAANWTFACAANFLIPAIASNITAFGYSTSRSYILDGFDTLNDALTLNNNYSKIISNSQVLISSNVNNPPYVFYLYGTMEGTGQLFYSNNTTFNIYMSDSSKATVRKAGIKGMILGAAINSNATATSSSIVVKNTFGAPSIDKAVVLEDNISYMDVKVDSSAIVIIRNGKYPKLSGSGIAYLYGSAVIDAIDKTAGLIVYDFRFTTNGAFIPTPSSVKSAVTAGSYTNGEFQGSQPIGSMLGMRFTDTTYKYEYIYSLSDNDGTNLAWIRTLKS